MTFDSFAQVPITDQFLRHVWVGELDESKGGHRFGLGREGKSEFPEHWDEFMLKQALELVLSNPQSVRFRPGFYTIARLVGDVIIEVKLNAVSELKLVSAYPVCGTGVYWNVRGLRIPVPLDISVLES